MNKAILAGVAAAMLSMTAGSTTVFAADITLHVMSWEPQQVAGSPWWDKITNGFEAKHPGVTIETNFVPFAQYLTTLSAMGAGNSLPDIFFGHVKVAELGRAGLAVDYKKVLPASYFDQFYPGPLKQFTFDNAIYGLPWTAQMFGIFANERLMKKLDLTYPQTWDDLIKMTPKIRAAGLTPLAWGNLAHNVCPDFFLPLIADYGGDVNALDDHTAPGVTWNSKPVIEALTLLQNLSKSGVFLKGINGIDEQSGYQVAYQGKAVMLFANSSDINAFETQGTKDWAQNYTVNKMPALTADSVHYAGDGSGESWVINAKSPNRDMALEFVKYMFLPDVYSAHIAARNDFPSMPSALSAVSNPKVRTMVSWLKTDSADHILFGAGSWDAVSNVCQGILDGSIEPAAGAAQIESDVVATRAKQAPKQ